MLLANPNTVKRARFMHSFDIFWYHMHSKNTTTGSSDPRFAAAHSAAQRNRWQWSWRVGGFPQPSECQDVPSIWRENDAIAKNIEIFKDSQAISGTLLCCDWHWQRFHCSLLSTSACCYLQGDKGDCRFDGCKLMPQKWGRHGTTIHAKTIQDQCNTQWLTEAIGLSQSREITIPSHVVHGM